MQLPDELRCIDHALPLLKEENALVCDYGCRVLIVRDIPRFVASSKYATGFGLQWNQFRKTQLDSYTHTTISHDRLTQALGGNLEILRGKAVLEVGCGAGRFTEVMLAAGARVVACDLSSAVEANYANCRDQPNYFVCQADARTLPLALKSFDFVVCLGVIQHTPSPEETIAALARFVCPGGMLVIDHYAPDYPTTFLRRWLRRLFLRLQPATAKSLALSLSRALLPLHKLAWSQKRGFWRVRRQLQKFSPLVDYYDVYPQLGKKILAEWSMLDTHDTLTDHYKHLRTPEQIEDCMRSCGLVDIAAYYGGNGVEAHAKRPI